jgi:hypothetical protein
MMWNDRGDRDEELEAFGRCSRGGDALPLSSGANPCEGRHGDRHRPVGLPTRSSVAFEKHGLDVSRHGRMRPVSMRGAGGGDGVGVR